MWSASQYRHSWGGGKVGVSNALGGRAHYRDPETLSAANGSVFFDEYAVVNVLDFTNLVG
jgi:hypothetical protein